MKKFYEACEEVKEKIITNCGLQDNSAVISEISRKYLIGFDKEHEFLIREIKEALEDDEVINIPVAYRFLDIEEAICEELFGFGELSFWWDEEYRNESDLMRVTNGNVIFNMRGHNKAMNLNTNNLLYDRIERLFDNVGCKEYAEYILRNGETITRHGYGEYTFERVVTHNITQEEMTIAIVDTLMDNEYEHFNEKIVESWSIVGQNTAEFYLADGRLMKITVTIE